MRNNKNRRNNRRPSSRGRNNNQSIKLLISTIFVGVLLMGGVGFGVHHHLSIEQPNEYGCYERDDSEQVAIIFDNSILKFTGNGRQELLSGSILRDYKSAIFDAYEEAPANSQMLFFTTARGGVGSTGKPVYTACKPAATVDELEDMGVDKKTSAYLKRQADKAKKQFEKKVDRFLADTQDETQLAGDSPIIEQIVSISKSSKFQSPNRSAVIITDGIQNSELARFCSEQNHMPAFKQFAKRADYNLKIKPDLQGVNVRLLMVELFQMPNPVLPFCSNFELNSWWVDYLTGNGANVNFTPIRLNKGRE